SGAGACPTEERIGARAGMESRRGTSEGEIRRAFGTPGRTTRVSEAGVPRAVNPAQSSPPPPV
ncbi:MAG: hypothetical protein AAB932_05655, partial [Patescibacteria group bacterium]